MCEFLMIITYLFLSRGYESNDVLHFELIINLDLTQLQFSFLF